MENTIGRKISDLRKVKGFTQEELAERLGVSPQAVSKWENDNSCPDIMLLPKISQLFGVTIDSLLMEEPKKETQILPPEERKNIDDLVFRIRVNSAEGDKVMVNLPIPLVKLSLEMGVKMPQVSGNQALKEIDFGQLLEMIEKGLIGKLVEVESAQGDIVEIVVE